MLSTLRRMMTTPNPLRPIVAVIGTTGVGKSQLAVSLAQSLPQSSTSTSDSFQSAVILSADSMQLYKGLDVITNKVTKQEMGGVEHWGLDLVQPGQGSSWEVGRWCGEADKKIATMSRETLPIICGGTHYFIQHFLFPPGELSFNRPSSPGKGKAVVAARWQPPHPRPTTPNDLDPQLGRLLDTFWTSHPVWPEQDGHSLGDSSKGISRPTTIEDGQLLSMHKLLEAVDPKEAGRWHWRDGRKVRRGLERWWERNGADLVPSGMSGNGGGEGVETGPRGRRARFRTLIFWVYEPLENLRPRLDKRVDRMVENGLLREIAEMRHIAERMYGSSDAVDHTEGIFQSIGYKEFATLPLPQDHPSSDPLFPSMLAQTKLRTHQYAKSQLKWIRKQLLPAIREARMLGGIVEVFVVPGGESGENVAREILSAFLNGRPLPDSRSIGHPDAADLLTILYQEDVRSVADTAERQITNARRNCDLCSTSDQPFSVRSDEWEKHLKSRVHARQQNLAEGGVNRVREAQMAQQAIKRAEREATRAAKLLPRTEPEDDAS